MVVVLPVVKHTGPVRIWLRCQKVCRVVAERIIKDQCVLAFNIPNASDVLVEQAATKSTARQARLFTPVRICRSIRGIKAIRGQSLVAFGIPGDAMVPSYAAGLRLPRGSGM